MTKATMGPSSSDRASAAVSSSTSSHQRPNHNNHYNNNNNNAWGISLVSSPPLPTVQNNKDGPVAILTRRPIGDGNIAAAATTTTAAITPNATTTTTAAVVAVKKAKKEAATKKGKPKLGHHMVLGDLLPPAVTAKTKQHGANNNNKQSLATAAIAVANTRLEEEFPALMSSCPRTTAVAVAAVKTPGPPPLSSPPVLAANNKKGLLAASATTPNHKNNNKKTANDSAKALPSNQGKNPKLGSGNGEKTTKKTGSVVHKLPENRTMMDKDDAAFSLMRQFAVAGTTIGGGPAATAGLATVGVQRVKPRKKKFSVLKKKVLAERLRLWRALHPGNDTVPLDQAAATSTMVGTTVEIRHYVDADTAADIIEDDDAYNEVVQNLRDLAEQCGKVRRIYVPRKIIFSGDDDDDNNSGTPVFCEFCESTAAAGAVHIWNGLVLGGHKLQCRLLPPPPPPLMIRPPRPPLTVDDDKGEIPASNDDKNDGDDDIDDTNDATWREYCLHPPAPSNETTTTTVILLENALTEDDLEDDECLVESLDDIRALVAKHGTVLNVALVAAAATGSTTTTVRVEFANTVKSAAETLAALSQLVLGGQALSARRVEDIAVVEECRRVVLLDNVLTEDDLDDEDALLESIEDMKELASAHGAVHSVRQDGNRSTSKVVRLEYSSESEAGKAYHAFQGMVIGGETVTASRPAEYAALVANTAPDGTNHHGDERDNDENKHQDGTANGQPKVIYSGDKIVPERFAECKRVPKVFNNAEASSRQYGKPSTNPEVKPMLQEMLAELMRLQKRAVEENNTKAKRRLVMGLREVARGIRSHKVKMVVMATNSDEYGVIDEKLQEIIDLCATEGVPVFYELSKRAMGKSIGKTIKIAVIGVQSAEGAHQQFKKLSSIAARS
jgi:ribosomal protein L7Ae-like RNA K-turn-binding protein